MTYPFLVMLHEIKAMDSEDEIDMDDYFMVHLRMDWG